MSDQLPPWVKYVDDKARELREDFIGRTDKLGLEIADERKNRELGDKDIAEDVASIATSRMSSWSWWVRSIVIAAVVAVLGGVITLIVTFVEAASHLPGAGT